MGFSRDVYWILGAKIPNGEKLRVKTILEMKGISYKVKTFNESTFIILDKEEFDFDSEREVILREVPIDLKEKFRSTLCEANLDYRLETYLIFETSH